MKLFLFILFFPFYAWSTSMCVDCHLRDMRMYGPYMHSPFSFHQSPWWYPYGHFRYSNWQAPGLWQNYPPSMPGHHYPGGGNMAAAKPNVYLSGAPTEFDIKVDFKKSTLWIAAPTLKGEASHWRGEIIGPHQLKLDGVVYPYLYYDYRSYLELFQFDAGFCGGKKQVITKMIEVLQVMGFREKE